MEKRTENTVRHIIDEVTANPDRLIPAFREAYPGITDGEARQLALLFTGLFEPAATAGGNGKALNERHMRYRAALDAAEKKYPGGAFPSIDPPALDFTIPGIDSGRAEKRYCGCDPD